MATPTPAFLSIRPYRPSDVVPLVGLLGARRHTSYPGVLGGSTPEEHQHWLESVTMWGRWVAVDHCDRAWGHVATGPPHPDIEPLLNVSSSEVMRLFVHPMVTGCGVGGRLLSIAEAAIRATGRQPALVVSDFLSDAVECYRRNGWRHVGQTVSRLDGARLLVWVGPSAAGYGKEPQ